MYPSDFADCPELVRYTLLAALCWTRQAELVDGLVKLLIGELANVRGKRGIFTRIADAALQHPDDAVRDPLYPVVPGGVKQRPEALPGRGEGAGQRDRAEGVAGRRGR